MTNTRRKQKPLFIKVVGLILSESYQKCKLFAERLHKHYTTKFQPPSVTGLLDMDWAEYLNKLQKNLGGKTWYVKDSVVVFIDDCFLGGEEELFNRFRKYSYVNPSSEKLREFAEKEYNECLNKGNLLYVYMELSLDDEYMGTLLFQLRHDLLPKSSMWFVEFCTHEIFSYRGTKIHRICQRGWFQAGQIKHDRLSSLGYLGDENFTYKHDRRGVLSFANNGRHTNKLQFFVTFQPAAWMDGRYVAFGRLVEGSDVLRRIENIPCTYEKPDREITITGCGLAKVGLGRTVDPSLRLKGITVGSPHLHLEFFVELIFEKFDQIIYNRLDEEVKRLIKEGEWIQNMIWSEVLNSLSTKRPPVEDVLDAREKSSLVYLAERYIAGLYSLPDIPDLYIKQLLENALLKAIETSDVKIIAKSVVDFLVNVAVNEATLSEQVAEGIVQSLVKDVLKIIFGSEHILEDWISGVSKCSPHELSNKESVLAFIWSIISEMLNNVES